MALSQLFNSIGNPIANKHLVCVILPVLRCQHRGDNDDDVYPLGEFGKQFAHVGCREVGI